MTTVPGFWEGGPHDLIDVEATWREFVRSVGGKVVDDLHSGQRDFENADILFKGERVIAELREIQTESDRAPAFKEDYATLLKRIVLEGPSWCPVLVGNSDGYPKWFIREFIRLFRLPTSKVLKRANRQIVAADRNLTVWGGEQNLGLPGGSSCIHTKREFRRQGF